MKSIFILCIVSFIIISIPAAAQMITEEEFIVEGEPVIVTPGATIVTTTPGAPVVVVPAEQEVYVGMTKNHALELLGPPAYVERFRRFTRRHHGIYDEVLTYTAPPLVLYIKEGRVQKVEY